MKNHFRLKKFFALFLAMVMALGMIPSSVMANVAEATPPGYEEGEEIGSGDIAGVPDDEGIPVGAGFGAASAGVVGSFEALSQATTRIIDTHEAVVAAGATNIHGPGTWDGDEYDPNERVGWPAAAWEWADQRIHPDGGDRYFAVTWLEIDEDFDKIVITQLGGDGLEVVWGVGGTAFGDAWFVDAVDANNPETRLVKVGSTTWITVPISLGTPGAPSRFVMGGGISIEISFEGTEIGSFELPIPAPLEVRESGISLIETHAEAVTASAGAVSNIHGPQRWNGTAQTGIRVEWPGTTWTWADYRIPPHEGTERYYATTWLQIDGDFTRIEVIPRNVSDDWNSAPFVWPNATAGQTSFGGDWFKLPVAPGSDEIRLVDFEGTTWITVSIPLLAPEGGVPSRFVQGGGISITVFNGAFKIGTETRTLTPPQSVEVDTEVFKTYAQAAAASVGAYETLHGPGTWDGTTYDRVNRVGWPGADPEVPWTWAAQRVHPSVTPPAERYYAIAWLQVDGIFDRIERVNSAPGVDETPWPDLTLGWFTDAVDVPGNLEQRLVGAPAGAPGTTWITVPIMLDTPDAPRFPVDNDVTVTINIFNEGLRVGQEILTIPKLEIYKAEHVNDLEEIPFGNPGGTNLPGLYGPRHFGDESFEKTNRLGWPEAGWTWASQRQMGTDDRIAMAYIRVEGEFTGYRINAIGAEPGAAVSSTSFEDPWWTEVPVSSGHTGERRLFVEGDATWLAIPVGLGTPQAPGRFVTAGGAVLEILNGTTVVGTIRLPIPEPGKPTVDVIRDFGDPLLDGARGGGVEPGVYAPRIAGTASEGFTDDNRLGWPRGDWRVETQRQHSPLGEDPYVAVAWLKVDGIFDRISIASNEEGDPSLSNHPINTVLGFTNPWWTGSDTEPHGTAETRLFGKAPDEDGTTWLTIPITLGDPTAPRFGFDEVEFTITLILGSEPVGEVELILPALDAPKVRVIESFVDLPDRARGGGTEPGVYAPRISGTASEGFTDDNRLGWPTRDWRVDAQRQHAPPGNPYVAVAWLEVDGIFDGITIAGSVDGNPSLASTHPINEYGLDNVWWTGEISPATAERRLHGAAPDELGTTWLTIPITLGEPTEPRFGFDEVEFTITLSLGGEEITLKLNGEEVEDVTLILPELEAPEVEVYESFLDLPEEVRGGPGIGVYAPRIAGTGDFPNDNRLGWPTGDWRVATQRQYTTENPYVAVAWLEVDGIFDGITITSSVVGTGPFGSLDTHPINIHPLNYEWWTGAADQPHGTDETRLHGAAPTAAGTTWLTIPITLGTPELPRFGFGGTTFTIKLLLGVEEVGEVTLTLPAILGVNTEVSTPVVGLTGADPRFLYQVGRSIGTPNSIQPHVDGTVARIITVVRVAGTLDNDDFDEMVLDQSEVTRFGTLPNPANWVVTDFDDDFWQGEGLENRRLFENGGNTYLALPIAVADWVSGQAGEPGRWEIREGLDTLSLTFKNDDVTVAAGISLDFIAGQATGIMENAPVFNVDTEVAAPGDLTGADPRFLYETGRGVGAHRTEGPHVDGNVARIITVVKVSGTVGTNFNEMELDQSGVTRFGTLQNPANWEVTDFSDGFWQGAGLENQRLLVVGNDTYLAIPIAVADRVDGAWRIRDGLDTLSLNFYMNGEPVAADISLGFIAGQARRIMATRVLQGTVEIRVAGENEPIVATPPVLGQTLIAFTGNLTIVPTGIDIEPQFQWQRINARNAWENIVGATGVTYTPVQADIGRQIRVIVTSPNAVPSEGFIQAVPTVAVQQSAVTLVRIEEVGGATATSTTTYIDLIFTSDVSSLGLRNHNDDILLRNNMTGTIVRGVPRLLGTDVSDVVPYGYENRIWRVPVSGTFINGSELQVTVRAPGRATINDNIQTVTLFRDITAPILETARITEDGRFIILTFNEALSAANRPTAAQFTVRYGTDRITVSAIELVGDQIILTMAEAAERYQVIDIAYTGNTIRDLAGNLFAHILTTAPRLVTDTDGIAPRFGKIHEIANTIDTLGLIAVNSRFTPDTAIDVVTVNVTAGNIGITSLKDGSFSIQVSDTGEWESRVATIRGRVLTDGTIQIDRVDRYLDIAVHGTGSYVIDYENETITFIGPIRFAFTNNHITIPTQRNLTTRVASGVLDGNRRPGAALPTTANGWIDDNETLTVNIASRLNSSNNANRHTLYVWDDFAITPSADVNILRQQLSNPAIVSTKTLIRTSGDWMNMFAVNYDPLNRGVEFSVRYDPDPEVDVDFTGRTVELANTVANLTTRNNNPTVTNFNPFYASGVVATDTAFVPLRAIPTSNVTLQARLRGCNVEGEFASAAVAVLVRSHANAGTWTAGTVANFVTYGGAPLDNRDSVRDAIDIAWIEANGEVASWLLATGSNVARWRTPNDDHAYRWEILGAGNAVLNRGIITEGEPLPQSLYDHIGRPVNTTFRIVREEVIGGLPGATSANNFRFVQRPAAVNTAAPNRALGTISHNNAFEFLVVDWYDETENPNRTPGNVHAITADQIEQGWTRIPGTVITIQSDWADKHVYVRRAATATAPHGTIVGANPRRVEFALVDKGDIIDNDNINDLFIFNPTNGRLTINPNIPNELIILGFARNSVIEISQNGNFWFAAGNTDIRPFKSDQGADSGDGYYDLYVRLRGNNNTAPSQALHIAISADGHFKVVIPQ